MVPPPPSKEVEGVPLSEKKPFFLFLGGGSCVWGKGGGGGGGGGVLAVYMTGWSDISFWLENLHPLFLFLFFLRQEIFHVFF